MWKTLMGEQYTPQTVRKVRDYGAMLAPLAAVDTLREKSVIVDAMFCTRQRGQPIYH
jgi:hypothetical protein